MTTTLKVNGRAVTLDVEPEMPLLWVLRDELGLTGTKYGCGIAQCGACTVHLDGEATRACVLPVSAVEGREVTTIEGLDSAGNHPVQRAWRTLQVPQCGYCQSGMIMAAAAALRGQGADGAAGAITNLCRCGTYMRVREAIRLAARG